MKTQIMKKPLVAAVAACMLGSVALPAVAADDAMMKRMEMLERELKALKTQMAATAKAAPASAAAPTVKVKNGGSLTFGGYLKADYRNVDGDINYQDYWRGNDAGGTDDTKHTKFNAKESRLNMKYQKGDVTGYVEIDFYGGDGNEVATNSANPRLRHAFIKTGNWMVGQYWTNFSQLKAFPEALDFGGPIVAEVFVRQPQIRYTNGNFAISLENPETWGDGDFDSSANGGGNNGADLDEDTPDLTATYKFNGDWGEVQVGALVRKVDQGEENETALAFNVGGRINVGERDDLRFQVNVGESGRYVGAGMFQDIETDPEDGDIELEETTAYSIAYRHFWNNDWRSTVYYGAAESELLEQERSHWGVNLIRQLSPGLTVGVEYGQYDIDDEYTSDGTTAAYSSGAGTPTNGDASYLQMSWKYAL